MRVNRKAATRLIAAAVASLPAFAYATNRAYKGVTGNWETTTSWSTSTVPTAADSAVFQDTQLAGNNNFTITVNAPTVVGNFQFSTSTITLLNKNFTVSGSQLTITSSTTAGNAIAAAAGTVTGSTFTLNNDVVLAASAAATPNLNVFATGSGFTAILNGAVSGAGQSIQKTQGGTLILNGINSYTGTTAINAGTVQANSITVVNGASSLGNATTSVQLGNAGTSTPTLLYTGGSNTYSRGFTLNTTSATVAFQVNNSASTVTISGTNNITDLSTTTTGSLLLGGAGSIVLLDDFISTAGLIKGQGGTLTSSGNKSYTGATTIRNGTLILQSNALNGSGSLGAATSTVNLGDASSLTNAAISFLTSDGVTVGRNIALYTSLTSSNLVNLGSSSSQTASSYFTGNISLNAASVSTVALTSGVASGNAVVFSGTISGNSGITKVGSGTVQLNGVNTYTGATTVSNGTLLVNNSYTGGGAFAVGSGAILGGTGTITTSGLAVGSGGTIAPGTASTTGTASVIGNVSIDGTLAVAYDGTIASELNVSGTLALGGNSALVFTQPGIWDGQAYVIATYNSLTGTFSSVYGLNGVQNVVYGYGALQNEIAITPEPGTGSIFAVGASVLLRRRRRVRSTA